MKFKNLFKIILCLMLSCSLCVSAPLARYQRIESHAAIAVPIAIGAATIAFMFLAACGINYVFEGMSQSQAESWLNDKMIEFASESDGEGGTMGSIPLVNNWKLTAIGGLAIASTLSNWLGKFGQWLTGNQADDTTEEVLQNDAVVENSRIYVINVQSYSVNVTNTVSASNYILGSDVTAGETYYFDDAKKYYITINSVSNDIAYYSIYYNGQYVNNGGQIRRSWNGQNSTIGVCMAYNQADNKYCMLGLRSTTANANNLMIAFYPSASVVAPTIEASTINQKLETVTIPQEIVNNYYYTIAPDVQTTTVGEGNIPVPLTAEQIAAAVWDKVSANSLVDVVYAPTIDLAQEGYAALDDVNSVDYDIPLEDVEQPAWDAMTASDVPAFATSIWNYFMQNHNWSQLKQKFPFSLPYDAYLIATIFFDTSYDVMDELPTDSGGNRRLMKSSSAPVYRLDVPLWDNRTYELVLDFSIIDDWIPLIRAGIGVLFTVGLIVGVL